MRELHGIIFSYEKRNELYELAEKRTAASLPFGGRYRCVDFVLSNLVNAGVQDVGVVLHGRYQSLLDHLGSGKSWTSPASGAASRSCPPSPISAPGARWPSGAMMEALAGVRSYLQEIRQDYVVLTEGDLVANLPLQEILEEHIRSGADITAVCADDSDPVENGAYFELDGEGRVAQVLVQPHQPRGKRSLETYLLSRDLLLKLVDDCASRDLTSFRRDVLQARREELDIPGLGLPRLRRTDAFRPGLLRAEHAAAGPGRPAGPLLPGAAHPGQERRQVLGVPLPGGGVPELPHRRRLQDRGDGGGLHPLPRGHGGERGHGAGLHPL